MNRNTSGIPKKLNHQGKRFQQKKRDNRLDEDVEERGPNHRTSPNREGVQGNDEINPSGNKE